MKRAILFFSFLIAATAAADLHLWASTNVRLVWTAPPYLATLPPNVYAPLRYRVERQIAGAGPWVDMGSTTELSQNISLLPCTDQAFRIVPLYDGADIGFASDVSHFIATCGDPDFNHDNVVNAMEIGYFKATYLKCVGALGYNPQADFNTDTCVTVADLNWFRRFYLKQLVGMEWR